MNASAPLSYSDGVFRRLLESMAEGVCLSTEDGVVLFANPAEEAMFGYGRGELIGRPVAALSAWSPEQHERLIAEVRAALGQHEHWRGEWRSRRKDGEAFFTHSRVSTVEVEGRTHWLWVQEDVTEQRRAQAALADSEARLELAAAAAEIGIWDRNLVTGEMVYSERAKAIYGFPAGGEVTYGMGLGATHPEDRPIVNAQTARALDPDLRQRVPYEFRVLWPDGQVRWVRAFGEAVFADGPDGPTAVRFVGTLEDVTVRKGVEEELRRSQARLSLAIDAGRMAVWSFEGSMEEFVRTPELNRVLGFPDEARPSLADIRARYAPGELARLTSVAAAAVAAGETAFEMEVRYNLPGGRLRWLLLRAEMTLGADKRPKSAIGVLIDITERKEAEERLMLLAREVDHRANNLLTVVQATVALTRAPTAEALKNILTGRISALAHAHQLLARGRWEGADLRHLLEEELRPFQYGAAASAGLTGPKIALRPQAAQSVAMAAHELTTNAAKYGALSRPDGRVEIAWQGGRGGEPLTIRWRELGGPPVQPPTGRGLGLTVVERAVSGGLHGQARFDWRPEGLVCELTLLLDGPDLARAGESQQRAD